MLCTVIAVFTIPPMLAWLLTDVQDLNISVGEVLLNTVLRVLLPLIVSILIIIIILYYISISVSICPNTSLSPSHVHVVLMVFHFVFWAKAVRIMGGLDYCISSQINSCLFLNNINYLNTFNQCVLNVSLIVNTI